MSSEPPAPPQPPTHQASVGLLDTQRGRNRSPSPLRSNVVPSPLPTRRTRTFSATVRASQGPIYKGVCKCFCRSKGHGFITPAPRCLPSGDALCSAWGRPRRRVGGWNCLADGWRSCLTQSV
uniref:Calcium regulated heat stable protein 1 n=1 Tax=Pipistrellus kuhlii TaxID=59472 RepID=A0A7J7YVD2_PIPKU|nr:calcium regulated heat stable protein 1 [Pipistrellus kuhlii]